MDLDRLLSNTADGVCAVTLDGKITLWNRAAEKMLGYAPKEAIGRPCCEVFVGRDSAGNRLCYRGCHVLTMARQGELVQHFDMATRSKAGKPVWLNVSIIMIPGVRHELSTMVHLFRDVTAAHQIETLVREQLVQASAEPANQEGSPAELTRRELQILQLMAAGANTEKMAGQLHISRATVRNHVQNILGKLGVHSRLEAVAHATRYGLL